MISKEIINIIWILMPGLISYIIIENFTIYRKPDFKRSAVYVIILNFISLIFAKGLYKLCSRLFGYEIDFNQYELLPYLDTKFFFLTIIAGIIISVFVIVIINTNFIFKITPSNIASRLEVWDDFLSLKRKDALVVVRDMKNNVMYYGLVEHYSIATNNQIGALHLKDISVYNNNNLENGYEINELYLPFVSEYMTIEFPKIKPPKEDNNEKKIK